MQKNTGKPTYQSDARNGKHKDIVWQVCACGSTGGSGSIVVVELSLVVVLVVPLVVVVVVVL